jgi:hypothetical protein
MGRIAEKWGELKSSFGSLVPERKTTLQIQKPASSASAPSKYTVFDPSRSFANRLLEKQPQPRQQLDHCTSLFAKMRSGYFVSFQDLLILPYDSSSYLTWNWTEMSQHIMP